MSMVLAILAESTPVIWAVLLGEGAPLIAALVVSVVLARGGFHQKLSEYRQDTLTLMKMRSETVEKQLTEAQGEIEALRRAGRRRERHIEYLELEIEGHHPARKAVREPAWMDDDDEEEKP